MSDPIEVRTVCPCEGTPHEFDTVRLRATLPLAQGVALQSYLSALSAQMSPLERADLNGKLAEILLLYGVESWTYVDARGQSIPVTEQVIRDKLLADFALATPVADTAADYYSEMIVRPLVERASNTLRPPQTAESTPVSDTSPSTGNGKSPRRKRSKPSSTTSTETGVTVMTSLSPGGASKS